MLPTANRLDLMAGFAARVALAGLAGSGAQTPEVQASALEALVLMAIVPTWLKTR
jgi:hypothetical protein